MKRKDTAFIIGLGQLVAVVVTKAVLLVLGKTTHTNIPTLDPNQQYLIVGNHQSRIDPFVIFGALPVRETISASPIKFMTARSIYNTPLRPLLMILGCFPTRTRVETVSESVHLLSNGYTVCFFPEGRRTLQTDSQPKEGVLEILDKTCKVQHFQIVLAHLEWTRHSFFRRDLHVSYRVIPGNTRFSSAKEVMQQIYTV